MKQYTWDNTAREVINDGRFRAMNAFFTPSFLKTMPKEADQTFGSFRKSPVSIYYMEWMMHSMNVILRRQFEGEEAMLPIWEADEVEDGGGAVLIPFLINRPSPCIIICPGGGYVSSLIPTEGVELAEKMNSLGFNAAVLVYRTAPHRYPVPQSDLMRAIRYVRAHPGRFHLSGNRVAVMGSSAGGHLCASVGALYQQIADETHRYDEYSPRPDAIVLNYPVISFIREPHEGSVEMLLGKNPTEEQRFSLSVEKQVKKDYPPTFVWHCKNDDTVSCNHTIMMSNRLKICGVAYEAHLYPTGWHGCGIATGTSAEGWSDLAAAFLKDVMK